MDLATIIQQAALLNNQQTQQAGQISALSGQAGTEAITIAENVTKAGQMAADAELTRLQGELNTQQARVKAANAFGTNVGAQSDVITSFAQKMREDAVRLVESQENVSRIEANSDLLTSPLGWLEDLLVGDQARAERDALAASFDTKSKLVTNLNAATQTTVATQNAISETLTAKSVKDLAQLKAMKGLEEASRARIDASRYGIASIEALQTAGAANFSRNMAVYNAEKQEEQWQLARADRIEAQQDKKRLERDLTGMLASVNLYRETFGQRPLTEEYVKRNWNDVEFRRAINEMEQGGWKIQDNGGSTEGVLGSKPSQVFAAINSGQVETPPSWKPSVDILEESSRVLNKENQMAGQKDPTTGIVTPTPLLGLTKPITDAKTAQDAYDIIVKQTAANSQVLISPGKGNPFEIPPVSNIFESPTAGAAALRESNFGKNVLGAIVQTGIPQPAPELVAATAFKLMDEGKLSFKEIEDGFGAYITEGSGVIRAVGGFTTANIPVADTYNVSIEEALGKRIKIVSPQAEPSSLLKSLVSFTTIPLTVELAGKIREFKAGPSVQAPKKIFNLLNPQDRRTYLTLIQSNRQATRLQEAFKGVQ